MRHRRTIAGRCDNANPLSAAIIRPRADTAFPSTLITCVLTAVALGFGGGGSSSPASELVVQLAAAAALAAWAAWPVNGGRHPPTASAMAIAFGLLLLPAIQLVPLPPSLWQHLPGRSADHAALSIIGMADRWRPWSVSPPRTLASLMALVAPAIALCLASSLDRQGRNAVIATVTAAALLSLLLGALQLADGAGRTWRFYVDNPGFLNGFQANRNAEADVLLIGAVAAAATAAGARARLGSGVANALGGAAAALLLGCALTGSRAGILLIALVAPLAVLAWRPPGDRITRFAAVAAACLFAAGTIVVVLLLSGNQALSHVAARFTGERDLRLPLWRDTLTGIRSYWPWGSGVGTFKPVFIAAERLESVDPTYPVRAHDDYLEFVLEGGAAALALLAAGTALIARIGWRARRAGRRGDAPQIVFCAAVMLVIALHSIVDYPLRSMALAHLGAIALGILAAISQGTWFERRGASEST